MLNEDLRQDPLNLPAERRSAAVTAVRKSREPDRRASLNNGVSKVDCTRKHSRVAVGNDSPVRMPAI